jgi:HlyD family secretion protein
MRVSYYTARIRVSDDQKQRLGTARLVLGMPVESFMQLGDRSVLGYLVMPPSDQIAEA